MRHSKLLLALSLSSGLVLALTHSGTAKQAALQNLDPKQQRKDLELGRRIPRLDPDVQAIVDLAATVSPEFAADALLRLAESSSIDDKSTKLQLITNAFYFAESAQQTIKKRVGMPLPADSRAGYLEDSFRLSLDRLSLQSRAVADMMSSDHAKARSLFNKIQFQLPPLSCEEALAYDLRPFYQTLGHLVADGFTEPEKSQGRHIQLLHSYLAGLQSHSQVGPLAELLSTLDLPADWRGGELNYFANSLSTIPVADKRSFVSAAKYGDFDRFAKLVYTLDSKGMPTAGALPAFRNYLISNFQASPCVEILGEPANAKSLPEAAEYFVRHFNELLGKDAKDYILSPIGSDQIHATTDKLQPERHEYWQSAKSKELLDGIRKLKFGSGGNPLTSDERKAFAWSAQLDDFLKQFESWDPNEEQEPADDFFYEKAVIYRDLVESIPAGTGRSNIIKGYSNFLSNNAFKLENEIEWLWQVHLVIAEVRIHGLDAQQELLRTFENSRDTSLSMYARLERVAPGSQNRLY
jgi:hypothetical protein